MQPALLRPRGTRTEGSTFETREAWCVGGVVLVVLVMVFIGPGETFSAGDLSHIRGAESAFVAACESRSTAPEAQKALLTLVRAYDRAPNQLLPLHGADPPISMRDELMRISVSTAGESCARDPAIRDSLQRFARS